jgi:hypothetical protein
MRFKAMKCMNDISWMFIQNMEYSQLGYFAKFTLPMSQVHFAKSPSQIDLTILQNPKVHICPIVKSMLPNPLIWMVHSR